MPVNPTYPGVYVQEAPSTTRAIVGVSTAVTAFLGFFRKGPLDTPVRVFNSGDFEREFGGLDDRSEGSYAVAQFFANDGEMALVVRVAGSDADHPLTAAAVTLLDKPEGQQLLRVGASSAGEWGNHLRVDVDYDTADPAAQFNLFVDEYQVVDGQLEIVDSQVTRNVSMRPGAPDYAVAVVGQTPGALIALTDLVRSPQAPRPAQTGTAGGVIDPKTDVSKIWGHSMSVLLNGQKLAQNVVLPSQVDYFSLPGALQSQLRKLPPLVSASVQMIGNRLRVRLTDPAQADALLAFQGALAADLKLGGTDALVNVQRYSPGVGLGAGAQTGAAKGGDGLVPGADDLVGSESRRTGLYSLDAVDLFNLLCIPGTRDLGDADAFVVLTAAEQYCRDRNAFLLVDMSRGVRSIQAARSWIEQNSGLASSYAAVYFPSPLIPDPLHDNRLRAVAPSGTVAGVYARTDSNRGVWKAPAGVDAQLRGVMALDYKMTDDEDGQLNPLGINALRNFPVFGSVAWGARTLDGSDARSSQWKYIPVRRVALYIEESLRRGLQWVVFEPNGEVLWSQIRLNAGAFMQSLFLQGAFKGTAPQQAYFVNCDASTTSPNDIDRGIVNVVVGFAPLRPAEFVILTIEQAAGQASA